MIQLAAAKRNPAKKLNCVYSLQDAFARLGPLLLLSCSASVAVCSAPGEGRFSILHTLRPPEGSDTPSSSPRAAWTRHAGSPRQGPMPQTCVPASPVPWGTLGFPKQPKSGLLSVNNLPQSITALQFTIQIMQSFQLEGVGIRQELPGPQLVLQP